MPSANGPAGRHEWVGRKRSRHAAWPLMQSTITVSDGCGPRIPLRVCARVDLLLTRAAVSIGAQVAGRRAAATTGRANVWSVGCAPSARDGSEILTQLSAMGNMCGRGL